MPRRPLLFILLVLALLASGMAAVQADGRPPATPVQSSFAHFFLTDQTVNPWWTTQTVTDPSGGIYTSYYTPDAIYYGYCAAQCEEPDAWSRTAIASPGALSSLAHPTLALDPAGHPRLMWYRDEAYYYAECNADCNVATHWTTVKVPLANMGTGVSYIYPKAPRYFALDSRGRPRLVAQGYEGFRYSICDGACTVASNWRAYFLEMTDFTVDRMQLAFDGHHQPRILARNDTSRNLLYLGCDTGCAQAQNWSFVPLFEADGSYDGETYALRFDGQGRPAIAFHNGWLGEEELFYARSDSSAITSEGWLRYSLPLKTPSDVAIDLVLDDQDRPHIVYATEELDLGYVRCTESCTDTNAMWEYQAIETGDVLDESDPIATNPGCLVSTWFVGYYPSLALDAEGNAVASYYVRHGQLCDGKILYDRNALRFAIGGIEVDSEFRVYLPVARNAPQ